MEIREQRAEDLDEVLALTRLTFGDEGDEVAAIVRLQVEEPVYGSRGWIALDGDRIIGHVALTDGWIDAVRRLVSVPVLSPLTVHPQHQGSGIGGALIGSITDRCDDQGLVSYLESSKQQNVSFYERFGFKVTEQTAHKGDPGYYSRHGFEATVDRGVLRPSTAIPEAAFQWVRLTAYEPWMRGRFVYPDLFWRCGAVGLRDQRAARATGVEVTTVTLGARDLLGLAQFYARLLGLPVPSVEPEDDWVSIGGGEGWSLAIQLEPNQERATWPAAAGEQHMQIHLEIRADDLLAAQEHALACGATLASVQPQDDVRVMFDPEGHPFCLWVEEAPGN